MPEAPAATLRCAALVEVAEVVEEVLVAVAEPVDVASTTVETGVIAKLDAFLHVMSLGTVAVDESERSAHLLTLVSVLGYLCLHEAGLTW